MALETYASQASDTVHSDVLSPARLACYKKESNKEPTEIASVGLLYPVECKKTREDYVKQCRPTWVKHFDRLYCTVQRRGFKGFWMIMNRGEGFNIPSFEEDTSEYLLVILDFW